MRDVIAMKPEIELVLTNEYNLPETQIIPYWKGAVRGRDLCLNFTPDRVIRITQAPDDSQAPPPRSLGLLDRVFTKQAAIRSIREAVAAGAIVAPDPVGLADRELARVDRLLDLLDSLRTLVPVVQA